jgi:hypothetical protein
MDVLVGGGERDESSAGLESVNALEDESSCMEWRGKEG